MTQQHVGILARKLDIYGVTLLISANILIGYLRSIKISVVTQKSLLKVKSLHVGIIVCINLKEKSDLFHVENNVK